MIEVTEVLMTCPGLPAQWEGRTADDRALYVRYRHGWLEVSVSHPGGSVDDAIDVQLGKGTGERVLAVQIGGEYDGHMEPSELAEHTKGHVTWPDGFA